MNPTHESGAHENPHFPASKNAGRQGRSARTPQTERPATLKLRKAFFDPKAGQIFTVKQDGAG